MSLDGLLVPEGEREYFSSDRTNCCFDSDLAWDNLKISKGKEEEVLLQRAT